MLALSAVLEELIHLETRMSVLARLQNLEHKVEGRLPPRLAEEPEPKLEIAAETYHLQWSMAARGPSEARKELLTSTRWLRADTSCRGIPAALKFSTKGGNWQSCASPSAAASKLITYRWLPVCLAFGSAGNHNTERGLRGCESWRESSSCCTSACAGLYLEVYRVKTLWRWPTLPASKNATASDLPKRKWAAAGRSWQRRFCTLQ